jgi:hypothetical protein
MSQAPRPNPLKQTLKVLLGANAASLHHLVRAGTGSFLQAATAGFTASWNSPARPAFSIPEITLEEILGDRTPTIQLRVSQYVDGMLPLPQAMALLSVLVAEAPAEVLEIGTFMGHTTRMMAENLPGSIIHTVDLPVDAAPIPVGGPDLARDDYHLIASRSVGREFRGSACESRIRQHLEDTGTWDFKSAGSPTAFFIDGSHTYDYCRNDSAKCYDLCNGRGVFLWHDCDDRHPGVVKALQEWRALGRDVRRIAGTPIGYWKGSLGKS